jgi:hypothetical protein
MVNVAVSEVELRTFVLVTVTPAVPVTVTAVLPGTKLVPSMVTSNGGLPEIPSDGEIDTAVGTAYAINVTALVVPPGVVTVNVRGPVAAFGSIVRMAVRVEELVTFTFEMVMPLPPLTDTVVPPTTKLLPEIVTSVGALPRTADPGEIDPRLGTPYTVNVTALLVPP